MTVGVAVLHVDDLCKGLGNAADEGHSLLVLLFQRAGLPADVEAHRADQQDHRGKAGNDIEPNLLVEGLFLDDLDGNRLAAPAHSVLQFHHIVVGAAMKVGVVHGYHVAAANGTAAAFKTFKLITYLRIAQGIVENKAGNRQFLGAGRNCKGALRIRINRSSIRFHIGDDRLEIADILKGLVNIDLAYAGAAGNIQIAVFVKGTVGVCRGDAGETV